MASGSGSLNLLETDHGSGTVIEPLLAIERDDLSGVLEFTSRGVVNYILARDGEIVFVEGGTLNETLGRILIRTGRMTEEQVAYVIRRMIDTLVDQDYVRFGETVVEYGFLTAGELDQALTQQMKEKLMGCVHRGAGEWRFTKDDERKDLSATFVVRTRPMLVDAAHFLAEREVERILSLDENRYPELVAPDRVVIEEFELSKEEAKILLFLDGTQSIHFIFSMTSSILVSPIIAALFLGGGLELRTTPDPTRQPSESRSIPPEFRTARRAKFSAPDLANDARPPMTTEVDPDAPLPRFPSSPSIPPPVAPKARPPSSPTIAAAPASGPLRRSARDKLVPATTEMIARAREALDRLKADLDHRKPISKRRRWPDPKDDRERKLMAESAFHQGRLHLRNGEAERALPGLHRALELCPEEQEYELYVKWTQMIVNDAFKDDAPRADVQWLAEKIVRVCRECELAYSILGHCTMHDGRDEAALRFFQRAALLDPKLVDSGHFSRHLAMRSANKLRKPLPSKVDAAIRRAERGHLDTPLDEIVPMLRERPTDISESIAKNAAKEEARLKAKAQRQRLSSAGELGIGVPTPRGGLRASEPSIPPEANPLLAETPAVAMAVTPISPDATLEATPPPPVTAVLPPPSSKPAGGRLRTSTVMSPWRVPPPQQPPPKAEEEDDDNEATEASPGPPVVPSVPPTPPPPAPIQDTTVVLATQPLPAMTQPPSSLPPSESSPPAVTSAPPLATPPVGPGAPPVGPAATPVGPAATPAPRLPSGIDLPTGKPRYGRTIAIASAWIASLAVTGSLLYFCGIKEGAFGIFPTAPSTHSGAVSASTSEIRNPPPSSAIAETTASAPSPAISRPAVGSSLTPVILESPPTTSAPPAAPAAATATAVVGATSSSAGGNKGTAILRAPKAYGRRIYVDGHIVGEGGRDLTVNCGPHKVKVGSTGTEKPIHIPCGGVIEVE